MSIKTPHTDNFQCDMSIYPVEFAKFSINHLELWTTIQGAKIHHRDYGLGEIVRVEQRPSYIPLIYVRFENEKEEKTFNPDSFKSGVVESIHISQAQNEALQMWKRQYMTFSQPSQPVAFCQPMEVVKEICFSDFGVKAFWHMTHIKNVISILRYGILNHYEAIRFNPIDISDPDAQRWRERTEPCFGRKIHAYAPLYISPRNPMMYVRKNLQDELCLLEISSSVLSGGDYLITDGNAASHDTNFFDSIDRLDSLPWDVLSGDIWTDKEDGKRKRCAEILVYPKVDSKYIIALHFRNHIPDLDDIDRPKYITPRLYF